MCGDLFGLVKVCLAPEQTALLTFLLAVWNAYQQYQLHRLNGRS